MSDEGRVMPSWVAKKVTSFGINPEGAKGLSVLMGI
jgi:hypothetical protein